MSSKSSKFLWGKTGVHLLGWGERQGLHLFGSVDKVHPYDPESHAALAKRLRERAASEQDPSRKAELLKYAVMNERAAKGHPKAKDQKTDAGTLSWTWQVLGMLLGTATAISIIKNGFGIDLYGLPAKVLAQYIWLRETLFLPLAWVASYFGVEIAWWVKDIIMAYALLGAAHYRAYALLIKKEVVTSDYWLCRWAIPLWPMLTVDVVREWVRAKMERRFYSRHWAYSKMEGIGWTISEYDDSIARAIQELGHLGCNCS